MKDKENEIQSTNRINEELQKKLDQGETELSKLKKENTELINITKRILETDNNEKLLVEKLKEKIDNLVKELNEVNIKNKDLEGELERKNEDLERKIRQLEPGRSLADEMDEVNMKVAKSTQTEIEYKSRGIQSSDYETTVPKTQDQGTQAKNAGVDASSLTDQKETKEMEIQTDVKMSDLRDLYDKEGKYVRTELSDPKPTPAEIPEKSIS